MVDGGLGEVGVEERRLQRWFPLLEWGKGGGCGVGVVPTWDRAKESENFMKKEKILEWILG